MYSDENQLIADDSQGQTQSKFENNNWERLYKLRGIETFILELRLL